MNNNHLFDLRYLTVCNVVNISAEALLYLITYKSWRLQIKLHIFILYLYKSLVVLLSEVLNSDEMETLII